MMMTKTRVEYLRGIYPVGSRVECVQMDDPWNPIQSGMRGTVDIVDDAGTIHVRWDNGRRLGLIFGEDSFKRVFDEK